MVVEGIKRSSSAAASDGKAKRDNAAGGVSSVVVAVRVRPLPAESTQSPSIRCGATSLTLSPGKSETRFNFDLVFGEDATQEAVYAEVGAPILRKALQGFNATIFAYGQTGSGKTHTMMGDAEQPGVVPRMASELFFCVDKALEESPDTKFLLTCSYLEIYNEARHERPLLCTYSAPALHLPCTCPAPTLHLPLLATPPHATPPPPATHHPPPTTRHPPPTTHHPPHTTHPTPSPTPHQPANTRHPPPTPDDQ